MQTKVEFQQRHFSQLSTDWEREKDMLRQILSVESRGQPQQLYKVRLFGFGIIWSGLAEKECLPVARLQLWQGAVCANQRCDMQRASLRC